MGELNDLPSGFWEDEAAYWRMRDGLLKQFQGQWVAVHEGGVVAYGRNLLRVTFEGAKKHGFAYVNKVGDEDKVNIRIRRVSFGYDTDYSPTELPRAEVTYKDVTKMSQKTFNDMVPDTGADITYLPWEDCKALELTNSPVMSIPTERKAGSKKGAVFLAYAKIGHREYESLVDSIPALESERILGRDVLNQLVAIFHGPKKRTIFK